MNKTDLCILSNNPFLYNMYVQNCRNRISSHIDTLHVLFDCKIGIGKFEKEIYKFYNESFLNLEFNIISKHLLNYNSAESIVRSDEIELACKKSNSKVFLYTHNDLFILNHHVLEKHINNIVNDEFDIIFCVFGSGTIEIDNIIKKYYPKIYEAHCKTDDEFRNEINCNFGAMDYIMFPTSLLKKEKFNMGVEPIPKGTIMNDILPNGESYEFKSEGYHESFMRMLLQMYSRGYQKIFPFTSERHVSLYELEQLEEWSRYEKVGMIHHNGSNYAKTFIDIGISCLKNEINTACFFGWNMKFAERLFSMQFAPILFFDFNKYTYMKEFYEKCYKPMILTALELCNKRNNFDVKINKEKIVLYGKNLGLKMFIENLDGI